MESNYPPGMTRGDWRHIDGEKHSPLCPCHEDNITDDELPDCQCADIAEAYKLRWKEGYDDDEDTNG